MKIRAVIAGALSMLALSYVVVPVVRVARDDPLAHCAAADSGHKASLVAARWTWIPPGWDCRYSLDPQPNVRVP